MCKRNPKLSDQSVREIRINRNGLTDKAQAEKYGVHRNTIWLVRHGLLRNKVC